MDTLQLDQQVQSLTKNVGPLIFLFFKKEWVSVSLDYPRLLLTLEDSVVTFAFLAIAQPRPLPDSFDSHIGSLQAVLVQLSVFVLAADVGGLPGRLPVVEKFSFHHGGNIFFLLFCRTRGFEG